MIKYTNECVAHLAYFFYTKATGQLYIVLKKQQQRLLLNYKQVALYLELTNQFILHLFN